VLEQIDSPPTVLAFRAIGKIGKDDYETVLEPAVSAVVAERGEVRLVVVLGEEYERYTPGAAWEDTKLGLGLGRSGSGSDWSPTTTASATPWTRSAG